MRTVTIGVSSIDHAKARLAAAFRGEAQGEFISFESVEALWSVMTPRRWQLIKAMAGKGPMSLRAAARLVGRDIKTTHGDAHELLTSGVLDRSDEGFEFPYDAVHVDFVVGKAA